MHVESIVWLAAVLTAPGLGLLIVLMGWLEHRLTQQMVADDFATALGLSLSPEQLEEAIARSGAALFRAPAV